MCKLLQGRERDGDDEWWWRIEKQEVAEKGEEKEEEVNVERLRRNPKRIDASIAIGGYPTRVHC